MVIVVNMSQYDHCCHLRLEINQAMKLRVRALASKVPKVFHCTLPIRTTKEVEEAATGEVVRSQKQSRQSFRMAEKTKVRIQFDNCITAKAEQSGCSIELLLRIST